MFFGLKVSNGGAAFFAGKSINNKEPVQQASIAGAVAMALHVRQMAKFYGIPVVLHSDHCAKKLLPWFDGMLQADEVSRVSRVAAKMSGDRQASSDQSASQGSLSSRFHPSKRIALYPPGRKILHLHSWKPHFLCVFSNVVRRSA